VSRALRRRLIALVPAAACLLTALYLAQAQRDAGTVDRANDLGRQGRYAAAARTAASVEEGPSRLRALVVEGYALSALGRHREAARVFREATRRAPHDWTLMRDLAVALGGSGDLRGARRELARARALNPRLTGADLFALPGQLSQGSR
jgi:Flp pilus assembly protein TadD